MANIFRKIKTNSLIFIFADKRFYMKINFLFYLFSVLSLFTSCRQTEQITLINANNPLVRYTGRINFSNPMVPEIYWPGTAIEINFSGEYLRVTLKDEMGKNYFNVVIDDDSLRYIKLDSGRQLYTLVEGLSNEAHNIKLIKRTEWDFGKTWFHGFQITNGEILELPSRNNRVIEFFGNSITAGYAIEDLSGGDSPDSIYTNNYNTYGAITARHFNADYIGTLRSGIGIMISWFPLTMPELYNRLDPNDPSSQWNFSEIIPDLVVVNLLQNDSWLVHMPEEPTFKDKFGNTPPDDEMIISSYANFIKKIRDVYPDTPIICALGSMDATREGSPWPGYVTEAVESLDDKNIYSLFFPFINKDGHPRIDDNQKMADQVIAFIEQNFGW
jgi:hypothetical protein